MARNCEPVQVGEAWVGTLSDTQDAPFTVDGWRFLEALPSVRAAGDRGDVARRTYIERDFARETIESCPRHLLTSSVWSWLTLWFAHRRSDFLPHTQRTAMHIAVMAALDNERGAHELAEMDAREAMRG